MIYNTDEISAMIYENKIGESVNTWIRKRSNAYRNIITFFLYFEVVLDPWHPLCTFHTHVKPIAHLLLLTTYKALLQHKQASDMKTKQSNI